MLEVEGQRIRAEKIVLATGSRPDRAQVLGRPSADRILTTDTLFEQETLPPDMAVIGLGVIGLELGQALHRLGHRRDRHRHADDNRRIERPRRSTPPPSS